MQVTYSPRGHERADLPAAQLWCIFPGMGKTFVQRTGNSFFSPYYYIELPTDNFVKERSPDDYVQSVQDLSNVFCRRQTGMSAILMLTSHKSVRETLGRDGLPFALFYPDISLKEEYIERYRQRGSTPAFIEHVSNNWDNWVRACEKDPYAQTKVRMGSGEYLYDYLLETKMVR